MDSTYEKNLDKLTESLSKLDIKIEDMPKYGKRKQKTSKASLECLIFEAFDLKSTKGTLELIKEIWVGENTCTQESIISTVKKIEKHLDDIRKHKEEVKKSVIDYMNDFGMKADQDYCIYEYSEGADYLLRLTLPLKDDGKLIDHLVGQGWREGRGHRNYDGDPSEFGNKGWVQNSTKGAFMVNMLYPIDSMD